MKLWTDTRWRWIDFLGSRFDAPKHRIHLGKGEAALVIPKLAHQKQVDLIVMGTVCRTGIAGFFIGNTAEKILQDVDCSVLTVKPEGFVSPVTV